MSPSSSGHFQEGRENEGAPAGEIATGTSIHLLEPACRSTGVHDVPLNLNTMGCFHSLQSSDVNEDETVNPLGDKKYKDRTAQADTLSATLLLDIMKATGFQKWTEEKKKGWKKVKSGMSNKKVARCKPAGVTFDENWKITHIDLRDSGLTGKTTTVFGYRH